MCSLLLIHHPRTRTRTPLDFLSQGQAAIADLDPVANVSGAAAAAARESQRRSILQRRSAKRLKICP